MTPRRTAVLILLAAALALVGCGVPLDAEAHPADPADVPFGLLADDAGGSTSAGADLATVSVYLVRGGRLWARPRTIPAPASPSGALGALAEGPTSAERDEGLRTELLAPDALGSVREGGGVVQVDVSDELADLPSDRQVLAVAEIVLTVDAARPGASVAITIADEPVSVPLPAGPSTTHPVTRADYASLVGDAGGAS
jgi:hypothetical protein